MGTTVWSPLASGILTGKYNDKVPESSRLGGQRWLREALTQEKLDKVKEFTALASQIGCKPSQLAIAWCLKSPHVSTVILGVSHPLQLIENLKSLELIPQLNDILLERLNAIFSKSKVYNFNRS